MSLNAIESTHEMHPIGWLYERVSRKGYASEELLSVYRDYGVIPKASRDDNHNRPSEDLSGYQLVNPGDLVINKMKAWQGSVAVSDYRGIVSPAYFIYRPRHEASSRFLHYLLRCQPMFSAYGAISKGIREGQWDLIPEEFENLKIPVPPLPEQRAIAAYLGRETADIDALVAAQEGLIETLRERRAAVVEHALNGLLAGARFKNAVATVTQGWSPQCESRPVDGPHEWGVLKAGCSNWGLFRATENKALPEGVEPRPSIAVRRGQIVVGRANNLEHVGSAALVTEDHPRLMLSDKLYAFSLTPEVQPAFVAHALNTRRSREWIKGFATGTSHSMLNVSQDDIRNIPIPLPPLGEQRRIADYLDEKTAEIDALIAETERFISVVKERRAALVTAAVTGQIDCTHLIDEREGASA